MYAEKNYFNWLTSLVFFNHQLEVNNARSQRKNICFEKKKNPEVVGENQTSLHKKNKVVIIRSTTLVHKIN